MLSQASLLLYVIASSRNTLIYIWLIPTRLSRSSSSTDSSKKLSCLFRLVRYLFFVPFFSTALRAFPDLSSSFLSCVLLLIAHCPSIYLCISDWCNLFLPIEMSYRLAFHVSMFKSYAYIKTQVQCCFFKSYLFFIQLPLQFL